MWREAKIKEIDYLTYCQICSLHKDEKLTAGQIARKLQLDKKTVRYWLRHPSFFKKLETVEIAYCFRSLKNRLPRSGRCCSRIRCCVVEIG